MISKYIYDKNNKYTRNLKTFYDLLQHKNVDSIISLAYILKKNSNFFVILFYITKNVIYNTKRFKYKTMRKDSKIIAFENRIISEYNY